MPFIFLKTALIFCRLESCDAPCTGWPFTRGFCARAPGDQSQRHPTLPQEHFSTARIARKNCHNWSFNGGKKVSLCCLTFCKENLFMSWYILKLEIDITVMLLSCFVTAGLQICSPSFHVIAQLKAHTSSKQSLQEVVFRLIPELWVLPAEPQNTQPPLTSKWPLALKI